MILYFMLSILLFIIFYFAGREPSGRVQGAAKHTLDAEDAGGVICKEAV